MDEKKKELAGYILVAVSAVTISIKGVIAKLLYAHGLDPVTLLALRFLIALPFFWLFLFLYPSGKVSVKDLVLIIISGIFGLYFAAIADFYGLLYIDASLERVIIYAYPTMVAVMAAFVFKERLGGKRIAALGVTYIGLFFVLQGLLGKGFYNASALGAGLVFFSAIVYAASCVLTESLSRRISSVKIAAYTTTAATFGFVGTWQGNGAFLPNGLDVWALLLLLGVVATFIPLLTFVMGVKLIGASKASSFSLIGPVATAILGYYLLDERLDALQVFGMGLVIIGVLMIPAIKKDRAKERFL